MSNMIGNRVFFQTSWIARGLILALIIVNLLLLKQNFDIRQQLADQKKTVNPPVSSLKDGESVTSLAGLDLNGQPDEVKYKEDGRQHLLLYFSPNCTYCVQQAPLWREMLNKVDSSRFEVLGIVSDKEDKSAVFTHAEELGYFKTKTQLPVLFVPNETLARYKLMATPTTLLISDTGNVEHVWVGKWDETKANEVAAALK
jgi:peroxiredoxin